MIDVVETLLSDYKNGYCSTNLIRNREEYCMNQPPLFNAAEEVGEDCINWKEWSEKYWASFAIYIAFALAFGIIAGSVTMTTKANLPAVKRDDSQDDGGAQGAFQGKAMYMVAGSGIPESKEYRLFVVPPAHSRSRSFPMQRKSLRLFLKLP